MHKGSKYKSLTLFTSTHLQLLCTAQYDLTHQSQYKNKDEAQGLQM